MSSPTLSGLAQDVRHGLHQTPKRLLSKYFYDEVGSRLFQQIMHLPEYYLTRCEHEILSTYQDEIGAWSRPPFDLVELGAGDGLKTKILLRRWLQLGHDFTYWPIDISADTLAGLGRSLGAELPQLRFQPLQNDYLQALAQLPGHRPKLVLFLGSNIGNFANPEALAFLRALYQVMHPGDGLLIGYDLKKHPATILAAYNDAQGVTKAFNLNILARLNRELLANFDLAAFDHYALYHPELGEARSYLVSQRSQQVALAALDLQIDLGAGEVIHTEVSRKYTSAEMDELVSQAGFVPLRTFLDARRQFADGLFQRGG
ncbi:MAG: L-histidine N(alpha)-methyltransferase [Bernardetiaceae bacterium]|jgi:dimethylhistidine N-methyltransferase|nr:L-histidine N(alpha)-methyltransferase [Bernardetiaceae bacterium]